VSLFEREPAAPPRCHGGADLAADQPARNYSSDTALSTNIVLRRPSAKRRAGYGLIYDRLAHAGILK
jgi:hypothetical protein